MKKPVFPEYSVEKQGPYSTFESTVYIYRDFEDYVEVYLYPVINTIVSKTKLQREKAIVLHLKDCLRISKYLNTDTIDISTCTFVTKLNKQDENFLYYIHYVYI
jgi:hypothetical protein